MPALPDPLHPAIIHFPVVLILMGTAAAVAAIFWRRNELPALTAALLTLGALGAWVAVQTGKSDGGLVLGLSRQGEALLEEHEAWGQRTMIIAASAALTALAAALLFRFPRLARTAAMVTALIAITASYGIYETGHRGGMLVFRHGVGVAPSSLPGPSSDTAGTAKAGSGSGSQEDGAAD
jgi:uncharacterized membrane protein